MADKHASGACALTGVGVQVSPPAPIGELAEWPNARDC